MANERLLPKELSHFLRYSYRFTGMNLRSIVLCSVLFVIFDYGLLSVLYLSSNQENVYYDYISKFIPLTPRNLSLILIFITFTRFFLFIYINYASREYLKKFHSWFVNDLIGTITSAKQEFVEKIDQGVLKNILSFQINQLNQTVYFPILKLTVEVLQLIFLSIIVIYITFNYLWILLIFTIAVGLLILPIKRMVKHFGVVSFKSQERIFNYCEVFVDKRHEIIHRGGTFESKRFSKYVENQQSSYNAIQLTNSLLKPSFELVVYVLGFTLVLSESILFLDALFILFLALKTFPVLNIFFNLLNAVNTNLPTLREIYRIHEFPKKSRCDLFSTKEEDKYFEIKFQRQEYQLGEKVIKVPECNIKSGETTLMRGVSGSGKTVFMKLFLNYFGNNCILINGKVTRDQLIKKSVFINTTPHYLNVPINEIISEEDVFLNDFFNPKEFEELNEQKFEDLSYGQKKRIIFVSTLNFQDDLFFLDEPTNGLDAENVEKLYSVIKKLNNASKTIIIASHDDSLKSIADEIIEL